MVSSAGLERHIDIVKVTGSNPVPPTMKVSPKEKYSIIFLKNIVGGIGWAIGATVGFALLISILGFILSQLGGLPLVGGWFARIIEVTNKALEAKKALPR